jgi:putative phosphoesterase
MSASFNAMSVLVLGDTHLQDGARLPTAVFELAARADAILHTGDAVTADVIASLAAFAPVTAVLGNCDDARLAADLEQREVVTLAGVAIGMVHDAGQAAGRHERLREWFPACSVVLYGHSHMPELATAGDGLLVLNPGSPTQPRRAPSTTVAWLELADGAVKDANLVEVER